MTRSMARQFAQRRFPSTWSSAYPLPSPASRRSAQDTEAAQQRRFVKESAARVAAEGSSPVSDLRHPETTIVFHRGEDTPRLQQHGHRAHRKIPPEIFHDLARIIVDVGNAIRHDLGGDDTSDFDDDRSGSSETFGPHMAWPTDIGTAEQELLATLCDQSPIINVTPIPPRRELRGYVPTSHGTGFRYNWKIGGPIDGERLFDIVEDEKAQGWRVGYLSLVVDPPGSSGFDPKYHVQFIRDDDSSFHSGVRLVANEDLFVEVDRMLELGRRPICILHTASHEKQGFYTIAWIQDEKYVGREEWILRRHDLESMKAEVGQLRLEGYRPISATICLPFCTAIYVRDYNVNWVLGTFSLSPEEHPVAALHEAQPGSDHLVPIGLDGKKDELNGRNLWAVVACFEHDLDSDALPLVNWTYYDVPAPSLPFKDGWLKAEKRRIYAFASIKLEDPGLLGPDARRYFVVEANAPTTHCRIVYDENTFDPLLKLIEPFPGTSIADLIDLLMLWYMYSRRIPALTLGILDFAGVGQLNWRMRAAYTIAPWSYPLTYPETPFRIGSVAKVFTAIATWKALEANPPLDETTNIFELLPQRWSPSLVDVANPDPEDGYPSAVLGLQVQHVLQHTTGWSDNMLHPGGSKDRPMAEAVAAGLPAEFTGYHTESGKGLLPLVRDDYMLFMLRREAFSRVPGTLQDDRVGWVKGTNVLPAGAVNYSGFAYDLLGAGIERLVQFEPLSFPGADYAGFAQWTRVSVFFPLSMASTFSAYTARASNHSTEAIYRVDSYLEEGDPPTAGGKGTFSASRLFSIAAWSTPQDIVDPEDAYDGPIPSAVDTPRYAGDNYCRYRLESALPRGGWASSAPDLCRFTTAYTASFIGNPAGLSAPTVAKIRAAPGAGGQYNLGAMRTAYLTYNGKGGKSRDASRASVNIDTGLDRIICWCRLLGTDADNNAVTALIVETLKLYGV